jgi:hypothetical protein
MSAPPKNRDSAPPPAKPASPTPGNPAAGNTGEKGKVVHDDRGNAKWDLGLDTAKVNKLTTSQLLKKLDLSELSLLDEEPGAKPPGAKPGGGFDPYEPAKPPPAPTKPRR